MLDNLYDPSVSTPPFPPRGKWKAFPLLICVPSYISGVHQFMVRFLCLALQSNHWGSHILSSWMVHAGYVLLLAFTCLGHEVSGSFESVGLNVYFHPRVLGNGVRTHVNSKGKIPSTGGQEQDRTRDATSCRTVSPTYYRLICSGLLSSEMCERNPLPGSPRHLPVLLSPWQTSER